MIILSKTALTLFLFQYFPIRVLSEILLKILTLINVNSCQWQNIASAPYLGRPQNRLFRVIPLLQNQLNPTPLARHHLCSVPSMIPLPNVAFIRLSLEIRTLSIHKKFFRS